MQENYINLCTFNFGKRCYVIMKNNAVKYFEKIDGKYQIPITSFKLYDNEGKSLTYVNQHFFMSELVNIVNQACQKNLLATTDEIKTYLEDISNKILSDAELKNILKGTFMSEIDEENFEENKKRIINYLNKFEINTFKDYNNVSIFDGNINKNETPQENVIEQPSKEFDFQTNEYNDNSDLLNQNINEEEQKEETSVESNDVPYLDSNIDDSAIFSVNPDINTNLSEQNELQENMEIEPTEQLENLNVPLNSETVEEPENLNVPLNRETIENLNVPINSENIEKPEDLNVPINNEQVPENNNYINPFENTNNSYIEQVQNRIMNNSPEYNSISNSNINNNIETSSEQPSFNVNNIDTNTILENETINAKDDLRALEDLTVNISPVEPEEQPKQKGNPTIIIIIIIILVVLSALAFTYFLM